MNPRITHAPCPDDRDRSWFGDIFEHDAFVADFGIGTPIADASRDGFIDCAEYDAFLGTFNSGCRTDSRIGGQAD